LRRRPSPPQGDAMTTLLLEPTASLRRRAAHPQRCDCERDTLQTPWKAEMCQILHARPRSAKRALLDEFLSAHEAAFVPVLKRAPHIAHLDYREKDLVFSNFRDALMRMLETRWMAKSGHATSPVLSCSTNLPTTLEAESRYWIREDRRKGLLYESVGVL